MPESAIGVVPFLAQVADPEEAQFADVVSRLRRAMRRAARAEGGSGTLPGGLSVAQLELLSCLAENPGPIPGPHPGARPSQLARQLRLAPSSVATLVNGLLRERLVTRTGGEPDRRTAMIGLTLAGHDAVTRWQQLNARILQAALAALAPPSRAALAAALPALRELTGAVDALADEPAQLTRTSQPDPGTSQPDPGTSQPDPGTAGTAGTAGSGKAGKQASR